MNVCVYVFMFVYFLEHFLINSYIHVHKNLNVLRYTERKKTLKKCQNIKTYRVQTYTNMYRVMFKFN